MDKITRKASFKGKVTAALACTAIITTLGTGTAFAVTSATTSASGISPSSLGVKSINVAPSREGLVMHIVKDGTHFYSVDGGEAWNDAIPDGFTLDKKGNVQKIK